MPFNRPVTTLIVVCLLMGACEYSFADINTEAFRNAVMERRNEFYNVAARHDDEIETSLTGSPKESNPKIQRIVDRDIKAILEFEKKLVAQADGRDYPPSVAARWVVATYAEFRRKAEGLTQPVSEPAFMSLADSLAYVTVSSKPDGAEVKVGKVRFDPTESDGFVVVEDDETPILLRKKGYKDIETTKKLTPKKKNELKFTLERSKSKPARKSAL